MPYSRGDVVLVLLPRFQPGHGQAASRIGGAGRSLTDRAPPGYRGHDYQQPVPIRAPEQGNGFALHFAGAGMGLLSDSVIMTDNLATVLNSGIDRVIGRCDDMQPVNVALCNTLGLAT